MACVAGFWLLSTSIASSEHTISQVAVEEAQLRAAVVLGILRFTSWPHQDVSEKPLSICTLGKPITEPVLLDIGPSQKVGGQPLLVRVLGNNNKIDSCDVIIYGPNLDVAAHSNRLLGIAELPIVTFCDGCNLPIEPTTVTLVQRDKRIGFKINLGITGSHGIIFSSSLLELAMEVNP